MGWNRAIQARAASQKVKEGGWSPLPVEVTGGAGRGRLCRPRGEPRAGREQLHEVAAGPLFPAEGEISSLGVS